MNLKNIYRYLLNISTHLIGVEHTKVLDARIRFHRKLNLKTPKTLSDKLCYLELHEHDKRKISCTDKYEVRKFVIRKGLEDILVPLCYPVCSDADQIEFDKLPNQFAMKATHGCAMNLICSDKKAVGEENIKKMATKWLDKNYSRACIEPHYQEIPHRVIFEKYLQDAESIIDYKIHCFHGKPDFILVCSNRVSGLQLQLYTVEWKEIDELIGNEKGNQKFSKPKELGKMLEIATLLSSDFNFVRVDLYDINGHIYFGELNFSPATGVLPYFSEKFVLEKGKLLNI